MTNDAEKTLQQIESSGGYLRLARVHADYLGGLRWSSTEDAIVYRDGRFFAFSAAISEFLEGFLSEGRTPAFGYLLHWMDLLQNQRKLTAPSIQRLQRIFYDSGGNWRCAGAFAAMLSDDLPDVPEPPDPELLGRRLRNRAFPIRWFVSQFHESQQPSLQPPIAPDAFESDVMTRLERYADDELAGWLRTGRGPIRHADRLALNLPAPRSLARTLAALLQRPRLEGAETYVAQLVGALALPPRRLTPQELPVGGFTDIVTRGQVEHLLPTQFALEELEFLRRFAEKELLYYRREEPPIQNRQELVILLDQGVRTWGDVRLVLMAAALAFGKQAIVRQTPYFLATTGTQGRIFDPTNQDEDSLGLRIEASDLSLNPGLALERTLEGKGARNPHGNSDRPLRDVVLLTHPRSARENDVLAAARRLGPGDRLFATTLDAQGHAELLEIRRGAPIPIRQFHVEFAPSQPKPRRSMETTAAPESPWVGDIESIPFPFRLGTEPHVTHFDFDYLGRSLLTVSGQGCMHLWKLDGSTHEMLPRPCREQVMKEVLGIAGVTGGFVVAGKVLGRLHVAHYDTVRRSCKLFDLGDYQRTEVPMQYDPEWHSITINVAIAGARHQWELDLPLGKAIVIPVVNAGTSTPDAASTRKATDLLRRNIALYYESTHAIPEDRPYCKYDANLGTFQLHQVPNGPYAFTPIANGKPCFQREWVRDMQLAGDTLAGGAHRADIGESITMLQAPHGAIVREFPVTRDKQKILRHQLSFDGNHLALLRSDHRVEVEPIHDRGTPALRTRVGGFTMDSRLFVGTHCLLLNLGSGRQHWHLFDWADGKLVHHYERLQLRTPEPLAFVQAMAHPQRQGYGPFTPAGPELPSCRAEDRDRHVKGVWGGDGHWYVLDRFGQVAVLDAKEKLIAMVIAFRACFAAWGPDGTRFGSQTLSLGPPTPGAAEAIGRALR